MPTEEQDDLSSLQEPLPAPTSASVKQSVVAMAVAVALLVVVQLILNAGVRAAKPSVVPEARISMEPK